MDFQTQQDFRREGLNKGLLRDGPPVRTFGFDLNVLGNLYVPASAESVLRVLHLIREHNGVLAGKDSDAVGGDHRALLNQVVRKDVLAKNETYVRWMRMHHAPRYSAENWWTLEAWLAAEGVPYVPL